jgi:bisphosphoglycerate-independent phosphoglycerate mutase (AlkP superfamily)
MGFGGEIQLATMKHHFEEEPVFRQIVGRFEANNRHIRFFDLADHGGILRHDRGIHALHVDLLALHAVGQ